MEERVALFGGSFNPPHVGHVLAASYVLSTAQVDRVLVVPVYQHALGKELIPFEQRMELSELAFEWLPAVSVSDIERELTSPSRTLATIAALQERHPRWQLRLMIGSDILGELQHWHAFEEITRRAPPLVIPRAGEPHSQGQLTPLPEVSSSEVRRVLRSRAALHAVEDSARSYLEARLPRAVLERVLERGYYWPVEGG